MVRLAQLRPAPATVFLLHLLFFMAVGSSVAAQTTTPEAATEAVGPDVAEVPAEAPSRADASALEDPFYDQVTVALKTVLTRVVNRRGEPVLDLRPEDLRATVGGVDVPIAALDWYTGTSDSPANVGRNTIDTLLTADADADPRVLEGIIEATDRLVVLFVQIGHHQVVTLDETYVTGHLKLLPHLRRLLKDMDPEDRVAVVSYDSHLKVWLDFTLDRDAVQAALYDAIGFGTPDVRQNYDLSLLAHLDERTMKRATSPEKALLATAQALDKLPGVKDLIFTGWGLGRYTHGVGVMMPADFHKAVHALGRSETTVSVLDVVQTDSHALAAGLKSVAAATGGTYASTYDAVGRKVDQLGRVLRGYYILSLDRQAMPAAGGKLKLFSDQRNTFVLHKPVVYGPAAP